jgi:hypothetical protein
LGGGLESFNNGTVALVVATTKTIILGMTIDGSTTASRSAVRRERGRLFTVSGPTVTLLTGGTCTVRASQAGNSIYAAAPDVDRSFLIFDHFLFLPLARRIS